MSGTQRLGEVKRGPDPKGRACETVQVVPGRWALGVIAKQRGTSIPAAGVLQEGFLEDVL